METRRCGKSELELPVLGIGCWAFGGGTYWGAQPQADVDDLVGCAIDLGANYFDTAEGYNDGESEISLGRALKGRRSAAIVGSKISPGNTAPDTLRAHCEATLKRLGTDYLDLYMIHWPINERSIGNSGGALPLLGDALATMERLRDEGRIRFVGLSNFGVMQLAEVRDLGSAIAVDQLAYNLLSRAIELEIEPFCRENGIGIIGYSALMQGVLSGKYRSIDEIPSNRTRTRHFRGDREGSRHGGPGAETETWNALRALREIADDEGIPMDELALAWAMANPTVTCTLVGARNREQVERNARGAAVRLRAGLRSLLDDATTALRDTLGPNADYYQAAERARTF